MSQPGAAGQRIAIMDLGVAQWRLDGVGRLSGLVGIGMGVGLVSILLQWVGGDLGGGYFSASIPPLAIDGTVLLGFWLLSLAVGALARYFPVRAATRDSPVAQLKSGAAERILKPALYYRIALGLALCSLILTFCLPSTVCPSLHTYRLHCCCWLAWH